jgi:sRNA-binding carbon storage regulator CsrA
MGKLVLTRKPGESIDIYDPADGCFGAIVITQGKISGQHSSIAIEAPRNVHIKRSEISGKENKYFALGEDPLAAIAAIGFTREVAMFGCNAYKHESLPLDMRFNDHRDGWRCVLDGDTVVLEPESFIELVTFVFAAIKVTGAK